MRRVFEYGRPYRLLLVGVLATIFVISLLSVIPPVLSRQLVDVAIPQGDIQLLTLLGAAMIVVPFANALIGGIQRWLSARAGEGIIFDLRRQLYVHLQGMSLRFFTNTRTGELISRLNSDVVGAQQAVTGTFVSIVSNIVQVAIILVVMLRADWRLTLLAVAALPLFIWPARRVGRALRKVTEQQMEHNATMSSILQETFNVSGALLVKLFNRTGHEVDRFSIEAGEVRDLGVRRAVIGRWFFAALGLVSAVGTAAVFWVGGYMVIQGTITLGVIVMFTGLLVQLYGPLSAISNSRVEFATSLVSFERVFEVIDLPSDIEEVPDAEALRPMRGAIEFDQVWFRYHTEGASGLADAKRPRRPAPMAVPDLAAGARRWALQDVSFRVEPGDLVALVGPSGAGKTTVSYLVPRLYDVERGRVLIDGHDVRAVTLGLAGRRDRRGHPGDIPLPRHHRLQPPLRQTGRHPAGTRGGRCRGQHRRVHRLAPRGVRDAGGGAGLPALGWREAADRHRRVILKDPRILVLDEATSHLDSQSEAKIQEALERVMSGRTSLVIAHRLSTVLAADRILVFDQGRLVEQGNHVELLAAGGLYNRLFETQFLAQRAGLIDRPRRRAGARGGRRNPTARSAADRLEPPAGADVAGEVGGEKRVGWRQQQHLAVVAQPQLGRPRGTRHQAGRR